MKRKSMKRKSMKRKTMKRNTIKRKNNRSSRRNFRRMRGGMDNAEPQGTIDNEGVKEYIFGNPNGRSVLEVGSKPIGDITGLIAEAEMLFVPSELKSKGETASNFRSTDARISVDGDQPDVSTTTPTNDHIINNMKNLFDSGKPYYQTALPRDARVLPTGALKFSNEGAHKTVIDVDKLSIPVHGLLEKLIPKLKTVEFRSVSAGKGNLFEATAGAYHCSMLADVFSFMALVNIATNDTEFMDLMHETNKGYNDNSSATVDGRTSAGGKSRVKKTFKCIHFIDGERTVTDFKDTKPGQARARQYLFNQLMEFLDEGNTPFKIKVKDFFENFKLTRLSDRLHNDIDDELLFVLLDDMNVSRVPRD
jgi:hypothetical protein